MADDARTQGDQGPEPQQKPDTQSNFKIDEVEGKVGKVSGGTCGGCDSCQGCTMTGCVACGN